MDTSNGRPFSDKSLMSITCDDDPSEPFTALSCESPDNVFTFTNYTECENCLRNPTRLHPLNLTLCKTAENRAMTQRLYKNVKHQENYVL